MKPIKFTIIDIMLGVAVLSTMVGCARREEPPAAPTSTVAPVVVDLEGYGIRKVCIEGTSYLLYSKTIVAQQKAGGGLIACEVPSGQKNF